MTFKTYTRKGFLKGSKRYRIETTIKYRDMLTGKFVKKPNFKLEDLISN